jgi:ATP-dependent helicase YprA (DUF1998 family)
MSQASFSHAAGSITFSRSPQRPDNTLDLVQPLRQTCGGVRFGFAQTIEAAIISLPLRMTSTEKNQLLTFFNTTVNGMAEAFTYTDTSGVAHLVRFAVPQLEGLMEKAWDAWTATVRLRSV